MVILRGTNQSPTKKVSKKVQRDRQRDF